MQTIIKEIDWQLISLTGTEAQLRGQLVALSGLRLVSSEKEEIQVLIRTNGEIWDWSTEEQQMYNVIQLLQPATARRVYDTYYGPLSSWPLPDWNMMSERSLYYIYSCLTAD